MAPGADLIVNEATNTGDGRVIITYDPATDACPPTSAAPAPVVLAPRFTG